MNERVVWSSYCQWIVRNARGAQEVGDQPTVRSSGQFSNSLLNGLNFHMYIASGYKCTSINVLVHEEVESIVYQ